MFERLFPGKKAGFVFDNSSAHNSLAKDALTVSKMNVGPGGEVPNMHDTIIPSDNPFGYGGRPQQFNFPANLPDDHLYKAFEGKPKGMRVILEERSYLHTVIKESKTKKSTAAAKVPKPTKSGKPRKPRKPVDPKLKLPTIEAFDSKGQKLVGQCTACRNANKATKPHLDGLTMEELSHFNNSDDDDSGDNTNEEEENRAGDCCMQRILSLQADFKSERSLIETVSISLSLKPC